MLFKIGDKVKLKETLVNTVDENDLNYNDISPGKFYTVSDVTDISNGMWPEGKEGWTVLLRLRESVNKDQLFWASNFELVPARECTRKYKVGDIVKVKEDLICRVQYGGESVAPDMLPYLGRKAKVTHSLEASPDGYLINIDAGKWVWTAEMLEPVEEDWDSEWQDVNLVLGQEASKGYKLDTGKLRMDLIPPEAIQGLAEVYTYGANKYDDNNWRKGMKWSRVYASLLRHLYAFWSGEDTDPESGYNHMQHVMWNAVTLYMYTLIYKEGDNREILD